MIRLPSSSRKSVVTQELTLKENWEVRKTSPLCKGCKVIIQKRLSEKAHGIQQRIFLGSIENVKYLSIIYDSFMRTLLLWNST